MNQSVSFSVASMLSDIAESMQPSKKAQKFNPRPAGVIQPGSATEAVLGFLKDSPGLKTEAQIIWATKFSHSAVSWALLRLRAWNKVEAIADPTRNSRYLRYKATAEASNQVKANG